MKRLASSDGERIPRGEGGHEVREDRQRGLVRVARVACRAKGRQPFPDPIDRALGPRRPERVYDAEFQTRATQP